MCARLIEQKFVIEISRFSIYIQHESGLIADNSPRKLFERSFGAACTPTTK